MPLPFSHINPERQRGSGKPAHGSNLLQTFLGWERSLLTAAETFTGGAENCCGARRAPGSGVFTGGAASARAGRESPEGRWWIPSPHPFSATKVKLLFSPPTRAWRLISGRWASPRPRGPRPAAISAAHPAAPPCRAAPPPKPPRRDAEPAPRSCTHP